MARTSYDESLDRILAEQELSDYKITVRIMSYDHGKPKLCFVNSKKEFPIKRIPIDIWDELQEVIGELVESVKDCEEFVQEELTMEE